jgi:hypothetical protein
MTIEAAHGMDIVRAVLVCERCIHFHHVETAVGNSGMAIHAALSRVIAVAFMA